MRRDWTLGLLLAPALFGCGEVDESEPREFAIAAPFTFAFEVSSIDLCPLQPSNNEAPCPSDVTACWVEFSQAASDEIAMITGSDHFTEEGRFWIEGTGRVSSEAKGYGHLNQYACEVEMTSVNVFSKIPR